MLRRDLATKGEEDDESLPADQGTSLSPDISQTGGAQVAPPAGASPGKTTNDFYFII